MPRPAPIDVVCAVIVREDGLFLVAQRPPDKRMGGLWEFPGGKVEAGEDPAAALRREIREEFGTDIEVGRRLAAVDHDYGDFRIRLHPFLARLAGGGLVAAEHPDWTWTDAEGARSLAWAPADLPVLAALRAQEGGGMLYAGS